MRFIFSTFQKCLAFIFLVIALALLNINVLDGEFCLRQWFRSASFIPSSQTVDNYQNTVLGSVCTRLKCVNSRSVDFDNTRQDERVTVVTAYFNIGDFPKGSLDIKWTPAMYRKWAKVYGRLMNEMVVFSDDQVFLDRFDAYRSIYGFAACTCLIERNKLWSFQLLPNITRILRRPGYPQYPPNTMIPQYGAAMHSKYAVLEYALQANIFKTDLFAWADVGVFRHLAEDKSFDKLEPFRLTPPSNFEKKLVAFTEVRPPEHKPFVRDFYMKNSAWLCGCFFLATSSVMNNWINQYRFAVHETMKRGWSGTDQHVIYAMFYNEELLQLLPKPVTWIQPYRKPVEKRYDEWYYLPYRCRETWLEFNWKRKSVRPLTSSCFPNWVIYALCSVASLILLYLFYSLYRC